MAFLCSIQIESTVDTEAQTVCKPLNKDCVPAAAVTVAVVKKHVFKKELQPNTSHHKYRLVLNMSDKENIVDARLMLCCLGPQQVKTPQCHSSRLFSCYMHSLTYHGL